MPNLMVTHILRGAQLVLAIILLGLSADAVTHAPGSPQAGFIVFASVWTVLVTLYFQLAPRFFEPAAHPFARLAVDALTMLFWFAGFIAIAVLAGALSYWDYDWNAYGYTYNGFYRDAAACAGLGALEWILFVVTTVFTALEVFRGEKHHSRRAVNPANPEVQV